MLSLLLASCIAFASCGGAAQDPSQTPSASLAAANGSAESGIVAFADTTATPGAVGEKKASVGGQPLSLTAAPAPPGPSSPTDGSLLWSDPATWGGALPPAGAEVVIPAGKVITLDIDTPSLAGLSIEGTLRFARKDVALTTGFIDLTGALEIGTPAAHFTQKATITLTGQPQATNDGRSRGLVVRGGRIELYGNAPAPVWTKLNDHAAAGATTLTLKENVANWKAGDTIAVAPTDFYGVAATERLALAGATGTKLALSTPLAKFRWGKLQYVTNTGMSLTPDPSYVPPALPAPTELDERAAVGNLSRNIVIQGADDKAWDKDGFGAHVMIMSLASKVSIDGVEFRRSGQAGVTARYPIHWHLLSYSPDGQLLGDAIGHVLRNSSIWNSANRCVVVHGTNGVQVLNNICQDIKGHAFFLEDAVERRNVFEGNLALTMRSATKKAQQLQVHETEIYQAGPSGFWLTNPDNTVRNNLAGDATGNGFWMSFPKRPLGLSGQVPIQPQHMKHGVFEFNTAHSNFGPGVLLEWVPVDAAGNVTEGRYTPLSDGDVASLYDPAKRLRFEIKGVVSYKNTEGAYRNRVSNPDYLEWVSADNVGTHMAGAGDDGLIARGLFIGTSLNNATPVPLRWDGVSAPAAFASYHSTFRMRDNAVVNFPFLEGKTSGMLVTDDYYISGIDKGTARQSNNRLINSSAGNRVPPPAIDGMPLADKSDPSKARNWTLSGALWDPNGLAGPKDNFWVYDMPFLTAGANCQWVAPTGKNGKSCDGQYYGVGAFQTDFDTSRYVFMAPIEVVRQDASGAEVGRWVVGDGSKSTKLGNMRHFAAMPGGKYVLRFPDRPAPKSFAMSIGNAFRSTDTFLFAVSFDGNVTPTGYTLAGQQHTREAPKTWTADSPMQKHVRWLTPASSLNEVMGSSGNKLWQDKANNLVWIKFQGGLPFVNEAALNIDPSANTDDQLYRDYSVLLYPQ